MTFMTPEQLMQWLENPNCSHCDKKAKWFGMKGSPVYCDEHYPYKRIENENNDKKISIYQRLSNYDRKIAEKNQVIKFMHSMGFDWICDINYLDGVEMVASKKSESEELWWRPLEVEGHGFTRLFKGAIKRIWD